MRNFNSSKISLRVLLNFLKLIIFLMIRFKWHIGIKIISG
jgi:hypothetical protein